MSRFSIVRYTAELNNVRLIIIHVGKHSSHVCAHQLRQYAFVCRITYTQRTSSILSSVCCLSFHRSFPSHRRRKEFTISCHFSFLQRDITQKKTTTSIANKTATSVNLNNNEKINKIKFLLVNRLLNGTRILRVQNEENEKIK